MIIHPSTPAYEHVAGIAEVGMNVGSTTHGADHSRLSHADIFARPAASTGREHRRTTVVESR
jgi:hypothetical protein